MNAKQTDLFGGGALELPQPIPVAPGRFALGLQVAVAMSRAMKESGIPRKEIAARVAALSGKRLTESVLDNMAAPSRPDTSPQFLQAMAFDAVTERHALLDLYAGALGGRVIFGDDILALEEGRLVLAQRALRQKGAQLKRVASITSAGR
ncbi:hypothetical protein MoryE10_09750 [Methylogaea oryzae]|uniref:Uncharacterized protein n=3 Tax=Methylogaea oryzae TaxID=1295382 RepID=A0A8D4VPN4_9GAMM|nr:hypothetical protein MoryE10_09750 [Methylogaea oryzae]